MSLNLDIDDTTRRNSLSALRWDAAWIDPALRRMAETAAQRAGIAVEAWMERAIRRVCDMPAMTAPAARLAEPAASPIQPEPETAFDIERHDQYGDVSERGAADPFLDAPAPAAPTVPESPLGDSLATEFPEPAYDDDVPAFAEAAHPTAPEPESTPPLFADAAFSATDLPHRTAPWRPAPAPATSGREARGASVVWAAGIAAVLAFCAVVAVRDPSLLHGRLVADNNRDTSAATPAIAANTPLHVRPGPSDRRVAMDMVPPPAVTAEDTGAPIPSPKIEVPPPAPVAAAPAPTPPQATAAIMPAPKADVLPPPAVALAEPHPVQMASLPSSMDDRAAPAPAVPAGDAETDQAAAASAKPVPAAKPPKYVAAELPPATPGVATAQRSTQIAMAPTTMAPTTAKEAGAAMAQDARAAGDLETRVAAGDHVAEYRLGILYALGKGVPRDYEHAASLLHAAAQAGLAEAQYDYGVLCDKGLGVTRDSAEAARWYAKAATQGHPPAALNLGYAYAEGLGVARNLPEAARWFRRAADAGLINAQFNLAYMFEQGAGVSKSLVDAYAWYSVAAEKGDQGAQAAMDRIAAKLTPHELQFAKARIRAVKHVIRVQN